MYQILKLLYQMKKYPLLYIHSLLGVWVIGHEIS